MADGVSERDGVCGRAGSYESCFSLLAISHERAAAEGRRLALLGREAHQGRGGGVRLDL